MAKTITTKKQAAARPGPLARIATILPWILIIGGIIGVIASTAITVENSTCWPIRTTNRSAI
ncbi:MAG: hypothetical protein WDN27_06420 [Candidatus Saccharibacteria bacterium]